MLPTCVTLPPGSHYRRGPPCAPSPDEGGLMVRLSHGFSRGGTDVRGGVLLPPRWLLNREASPLFRRSSPPFGSNVQSGSGSPETWPGLRPRSLRDLGSSWLPKAFRDLAARLVPCAPPSKKRTILIVIIVGSSFAPAQPQDPTRALERRWGETFLNM